HEAIRPTSMQYDPETVRPYLTPDQLSLYRLIWNRFVASQMMPATFDETTVDVTAGDYLFRVKGTVPKFAGWMATYGQQQEGPARADEARSPAVGQGREPALEADAQRLQSDGERAWSPARLDENDDEDGVSGV